MFPVDLINRDLSPKTFIIIKTREYNKKKIRKLPFLKVFEKHKPSLYRSNGFNKI